MARSKRIEFIGLDEPGVMVRARAIVDGALIGVGRKTKYTFNYYVKIRRSAKEGPSDIDFMEAHFGGYRKEQQTPDGPVYWLNLQQRRATMLIDMVYVWLERNRRASDIMRKMKWHVSRNGNSRLTEGEIAIRKTLLAEMAQIHQDQYGSSGHEA